MSVIDPIDALTIAATGRLRVLVPMLREAAIFDLREHFDERFAWWQADRHRISTDMAANFFMPFRTVIVRHATGATLVHRDVRTAGTESAPFLAAECVLVESDHNSCMVILMRPEMHYQGEARYIVHPNADVAVGVTRGQCADVWTGKDLADLLLDRCNFHSVRNSGPLPEGVSAHVMNFTTSLDDMWWALQPSNWIVKKTPEMARRVQRGVLPLAHQRERYIVMSQREMERVFRLPNPENTGRLLKVGHRRRACWHTLKHERFGERRGQRVFVSGCWVGPEEVVVGGERYRVILDSPGWSGADLPDLPEGTVEL